MNIFILNKNFERVLLVENFQSLIWNDKYDEAGDFELYLPAGAYDISFFDIGNYLWAELSDRLMIVEKIECETGAEDGDFLTVSGRSLESILSRRILIDKMDFTGSLLQDAIEKMIVDNVINPINSKRIIPNVIFVKNTDPRILSITIDNQYEGGENLYDVIHDLVTSKKVGMKMVRDKNGFFVFNLYMGTDRSYKQDSNPWIVFSQSFENIISSEYLSSITDYKNQIIVDGEYEEEPDEEVEPDIKIENTRKPIRIEVGDFSGLDRFEYYVNASDIDSRIVNEEDPEDETYLTEEEFTAKLIERGNETLEDYKKEETFEAEVDYSHTFIMGKDYFLGDILQVSNQYGISSSLRVNEYIISISSSGEEHYPKFINPEKESD